MSTDIQFNPKESQPADESTRRGLLALTIVHAVEFSRIGRTSPTRLPSSSSRHLDSSSLPYRRQAVGSAEADEVFPLEVRESCSPARLGDEELHYVCPGGRASGGRTSGVSRRAALGQPPLDGPPH